MNSVGFSEFLTGMSVYAPVAYGVAGLLGLVMGSFFGVLADRLSVGELPNGRSRCDHCNKPLRPRDLIPIYSYLRTGGKSACCHKPLSRWYPGVELFTALSYIALTAYIMMPGTLIGQSWVSALSLYVIISASIVIIMADAKYHIIPDAASQFIAISGIAQGIVMGEVVVRLLAGIVLFSIMYTIYAATRGKSMGYGDVKFAGVMGIVLGMHNGLLALYLAFLAGGLYGMWLIIGRRAGFKSSLAFGPFLVAGMLVMLFFGQDVWKMVGRLF